MINQNPLHQPEHKNGFKCPKCETHIETSLQDLLYQASITCPKCLTNFSMDREESSKAIELMQKLKVALENIDTAKKFKG
ncbi:hypothetical protein [Marinoscillum pacificum]|uniref:hypothetical protein n=1 Tax=Marinoscillum pacificum TaxID=392723 RepID=UPI002157D42F|nr:hypothetical protein [Marinoscillum pacificum]